MTPMEWLLAAVGSCMGMSAVRYLETQGIDSKGLQLSLRVEDDTSAIAGLVINVHVILETPLDHDQRLALKAEVETCELFQVLQHPPTIRTEILASLP